MNPRTKIEVTTGTLVRFLLLVLGLVFLYVIRDIVLIILVSIVVASSVEPLVRWFERYRFPRVLAVLIIYLGGVTSIFSVFYLLIPPLFSDFQNFFSSLPFLIDKAFVQLHKVMPLIPFDLILPTLKDVVMRADITVRSALDGAFSATSLVFSKMFDFVFVFVISFYLAVQEDGIANVLRILTPKEHEEYILHLWARSRRKIGRWLQGQLLLGLIIGVIVFIALTVLQVRYAFILAVLTGMLEIIPYFGPVLAAMPAIAVAAIQSPLLGLLVAGIYILVQQMENHLIYPQVVRKTVGVPPLLAIIALLIGGKLAGIMGFIIAVPMAVILVEYVNDIAEHKKTVV
ncbi:MAG TPA: AI-2E family transporter [Candidatus Paceibacterota bacterium]